MTDADNRVLEDQGAFESLWQAWSERRDISALGRLMEMENAPLCQRAARLGTKVLPGAPQPGDLVQDTFLRARQFIHGFRGETRAEWRVWLSRILVNEWTRHLRRVECRQAFSPSSPHARFEAIVAESGAVPIDPRTPPSQAALRNERRQALRDALTRLPQLSRQILIAHEIDGRTFEEVGDSLGMTPEAARQRCNRALKRLREELRFLYESS